MIYVLRLQQKKWFVGTTAAPNQEWTRRYPPIEIYSVEQQGDEDAKTLQLMARFGIHAVRGGSFTSFVLSRQTTRTIERRIRLSDESWS